jgi:replication-associated recombination protein RarA
MSLQPKCIKDLLGNKESIKNIIKWVKNEKIKGCLLISGKTGLGKTAIVETILNEYKCNKMELSLNVLTPLKLNEFIFKTNGYVNINNYFTQKKQKIIFIDNIDIVSPQTIKEIIKILKKDFNEKIICITNDKTNTKIKTLNKLKNTTTILIKKSKITELIQFCNKYFKSEKWNNNEKQLIDIIIGCNYDIRQLIIILEYSTNDVDDRFKIYDSVKELITISDIPIEKIDKMYENDTFMIPYFMHDNYLNSANNLKTICKCANSFSNHDIFTKKIFDLNENNYNSTYSCIIPNYYLTKQNKNANTNKYINIKFPLLLSRKSQSSVNLKK